MIYMPECKLQWHRHGSQRVLSVGHSTGLAFRTHPVLDRISFSSPSLRGRFRPLMHSAHVSSVASGTTSSTFSRFLGAGRSACVEASGNTIAACFRLAAGAEGAAVSGSSPGRDLCRLAGAASVLMVSVLAGGSPLAEGLSPGSGAEGCLLGPESAAVCVSACMINHNDYQSTRARWRLL